MRRVAQSWLNHFILKKRHSYNCFIKFSTLNFLGIFLNKTFASWRAFLNVVSLDLAWTKTGSLADNLRKVNQSESWITEFYNLINGNYCLFLRIISMPLQFWIHASYHNLGVSRHRRMFNRESQLRFIWPRLLRQHSWFLHLSLPSLLFHVWP